MKRPIEVNLLVKLLNYATDDETTRRELVTMLNNVRWLAYNWRFDYAQDRVVPENVGRITVQPRE